MTGHRHTRVGATNREFASYDQVRKNHTYRLAESADERFDENFRIRTCDLSRFLHGGPAGQAAFAAELGAALEEIGFAILVGHGIDARIHDDADAAVRGLFHRTTLEDRLRHRARRHGSINQGYFPIEETSEIHPDLVEGWVFCRRAFDLDDGRCEPFRAADFWPDPLAEPPLRRMLQAQETLILPVMQSILMFLGCDPHLFDGRLAGTNCALRLNYYPPLSPAQEESGAGRLLGHEDVDLFTFLPAPRVEGLQVWNHNSSAWVRLNAPPGSLVLNVGDYTQRITNDRLLSTTHRVSKPRDERLLHEPRVTFPMNVYLWEDEMLEVLPGLPSPRYPPVKAIEFHTRTTSKFYGDAYAVTDPDEPSR